jgi:hypothetical protein
VDLEVPPFDRHQTLTQKKQYMLAVGRLLPTRQEIELVHAVDRAIRGHLASGDPGECGEEVHG